MAQGRGWPKAGKLPLLSVTFYPLLASTESYEASKLETRSYRIRFMYATCKYVFLISPSIVLPCRRHRRRVRAVAIQHQRQQWKCNVQLGDTLEMKALKHQRNIAVLSFSITLYLHYLYAVAYIQGTYANVYIYVTILYIYTRVLLEGNVGFRDPYRDTETGSKLFVGHVTFSSFCTSLRTEGILFCYSLYAYARMQLQQVRVYRAFPLKSTAWMSRKSFKGFSALNFHTFLLQFKIIFRSKV